MYPQVTGYSGRAPLTYHTTYLQVNQVIPPVEKTERVVPHRPCRHPPLREIVCEFAETV